VHHDKKEAVAATKSANNQKACNGKPTALAACLILLTALLAIRSNRQKEFARFTVPLCSVKRQCLVSLTGQ